MGESGVGAWTGLAVGVELNSKGEGLWLTDSILLMRGMHGVTESTSLNWLFGVSCMLLMLSSCIWGGSDSISGDVIGSSVKISLDQSAYLRVRERVVQYSAVVSKMTSSLRCCSIGLLMKTVGGGWQNFIHCLEAQRFAHWW